MYILGVNPIKSSKWQPPEGDELPNLDNTYLTPGARGIKKKNEARAPDEQRQESVVMPQNDPDVVKEASGARQ